MSSGQVCCCAWLRHAKTPVGEAGTTFQKMISRLFEVEKDGLMILKKPFFQSSRRHSMYAIYAIDPQNHPWPDRQSYGSPISRVWESVASHFILPDSTARSSRTLQRHTGRFSALGSPLLDFLSNGFRQGFVALNPRLQPRHHRLPPFPQEGLGRRGLKIRTESTEWEEFDSKSLHHFLDLFAAKGSLKG